MYYRLCGATVVQKDKTKNRKRLQINHLRFSVVALSRFELLTSCLSSRRSKPAELKDLFSRPFGFGTANIANFLKFLAIFDFFVKFR